MFEVFEHTADLGLRIRADSRNALFEEAALALSSLLAVNLSAIRPLQPRTLTIAGGTGDEYLLFDWLNELLYIFETEHLIFRDFRVEVTDEQVSAVCRGEPYCPDRHGSGHEVKAITYHGLSVRHEAGRWTAEVIVDI